MIRALAGMVAAALITARARMTGSLTVSGQWAAFATGVLATAAGWGFAAILFLFFVTSSGLTRWRGAEKHALTVSTVPQLAERNARQVFANGGVFLVCCLAYIRLHDARAVTAALGAIAAATADTWATEVGTILGGIPRSITTWRPLARGMSGGVTAVGTLAAVVGAMGIALVAIPLFHLSEARLPIAIAVGGVVGCLMDSLVGATIQARRWCERCGEWTERRVHPCGYRSVHRRGFVAITNDAVNLTCTGTGAVAAVVMAMILKRLA
jgi:uncharacterized protein (TIGR00297 family)